MIKDGITLFKEQINNYNNLLIKNRKEYIKKYWKISLKDFARLSSYCKLNKKITIEEFYNKWIANNIKSQKLKNKRKLNKENKIQSYKSYIVSDEWKKKRLSFIKKYKNKCQCCKQEYLDKDLSLHHHTYERVWKELDTDLVLVCVKCHSDIHYNNWKKVRLIEKKLRKRFNEISYNYNYSVFNNSN